MRYVSDNVLSNKRWGRGAKGMLVYHRSWWAERIIVFGIAVPIIFVLALFLGTREEKKWINIGLLVAEFLPAVIGLAYFVVKR